MTTRISSKSVLAVGAFFFMSLISWTAGAVVDPQSTEQTSCTAFQIKYNLCSMATQGTLRGLGNTSDDKHPTAYTVKILIHAGVPVIRNKPGKSGTANGVRFVDVAIQLTGSQAVNWAQVKRNGRSIEKVFFHDHGENGLVTVFLPVIQYQCDNGDPDDPTTQEACDFLDALDKHPNSATTVVVYSVDVLGIQFVDDDPNTNTCVIYTDPGPDGELGTDDDGATTITGDCRAEDILGQRCAAPFAIEDAASYAWEKFTYGCVDVCHDKNGDPRYCVDANGDPVTDLPFPEGW